MSFLNLKMFKTALCVVFLLSCTIALDITANVHSHNKVVTCYIASWAAYRPGNTFTIYLSFKLSNIIVNIDFR